MENPGAYKISFVNNTGSERAIPDNILSLSTPTANCSPANPPPNWRWRSGIFCFEDVPGSPRHRPPCDKTPTSVLIFSSLTRPPVC